MDTRLHKSANSKSKKITKKNAPNVIKPKEAVNHPAHYNTGSIEVIDFIEDLGMGEGFNLGNAIKYISRAGKKHEDVEMHIEDLRKAVWYVSREIIRLEKTRRNPESK